jgi:Na+-transporting NADH:ubiquinone oxidoreductase subunit NqrF
MKNTVFMFLIVGERIIKQHDPNANCYYYMSTPPFQVADEPDPGFRHLIGSL